MYSFAQRKDTLVWDEPLYAYYLRQTGIEHPGREETLEVHDSDPHRVVQQMLFGERERPVLFCKQMAHHLLDLNTDWLASCINIFLIRHPAEVIRSFSKVISHPTLRDIGIAHQWRLFQALRAQGELPLVIDGQWLLQHPEHVLRQACEGMRIDFDPAMLRWEAGARPEDGAWAPYWYHAVHASSGFEAYVPKSREIRPDLMPLLESALPSYEAMSAHAIRP